MTTGRRPPGDKETWWWNDEVKDAIRAKKYATRCGKHQRQEERETVIGKQTMTQRKK